jgi:hypothetical protein
VSDIPHRVSEPGNPIPAIKRADRRRWQVGLRTLFLLMAAVAVWMAYFINRRQSATLEARIKAMVPLAHELIIEDAKKIAVVKLEEYWYDENRWEISLPDGRYRLCVATRGIDDMGLAPPVKSTPLKAGRHHIELEQRRDHDVWRVTVLWDETALLAVEERKDWDPGHGSAGGGQFARSEQLSPDKPVVLFRRRFMREVGKDQITQITTPPGPTEGILLWIERIAASSPTP